jgi:radical SAM protein with 4Fe4S-binding SPASM domain
MVGVDQGFGPRLWRAAARDSETAGTCIRRARPTAQPAMKPLRYTYAVWEFTLQCNLGCVHCGSRAASPRAAELSTAEALDLVGQLHDAGIREITLIGGEAYLRSDWLTIVKAIRAAGISCTLTTGGYGISAAAARAMRDAGLQQVSVSIDGCEQTHDLLRGKPGSWNAAFRSLRYLRQAGVPVTCNTQINRLSAPELPLIYTDIAAAGCRAWQLQLTVPMGRAADRPEILLQPQELLDVFPMLNELATWARRDGVLFFPGNNIGYYGPYERRLRAQQGKNAIWDGCQAGITTLGIEADGTIKGCPSLPTAAYSGGNIREHALREILDRAPALSINAGQGTPAATEPLWGFCRTCDYAELCRGGCSWTAHVFFGRRGNNPYCHHRALVHAREGKRERLVLEQHAPGEPFDHGVFGLIEESAQAPWPEDDPFRFRAEQIRWSAPVREQRRELPVLG